ncbi:MAG: riboflavin synthase subunit alpha [Litorivicinus sp.]
MFTGIVQGRGEVIARSGQDLVRLVIRVPSTQGLTRGASIAINGVCLTAVEWQDCDVHFDVIAESLRITNLGQLRVGDSVNVERAARFGDEIGGHLLSGHIHAMAQLVQREVQGDNLALTLQVDPELARYLMPKGYVALDGCSLTLGPAIESGRFQVFLIPETREVTVIEQRQPGDWINLEIDTQTQAVVDTVERVLAERNR